MCSGLGWSNDQHVRLHVCRPHDYMACRVCGHMCLERCARSGVPPLAKPIRGFFAATVHFGRFLLSLPFARPRPQNRWHPWRIANRSAPCVRALWAPFVQTYCRVTSHEYVLCYGRHGCYERAAFLLGRRLPLDPVWAERFIRLSRLGCADRP